MELAARGTFSYAGLRSFDLFGDIPGVIGMDQIEQEVANFGHCFRNAVGRMRSHGNAGQFCQASKIEWCALKRLMWEGEVVTLHVPLSAVSDAV